MGEDLLGFLLGQVFVQGALGDFVLHFRDQFGRVFVHGGVEIVEGADQGGVVLFRGFLFALG